MRLKGENIKIKKGAVAIIMALAMSAGTVSCSSDKVPEIEETLNRTTVLTQDDSMLDDVLKISGQDYGTLTELDKLDRAIAIYEDLKDTDLEKYSYILSEEDRKNLDNMPHFQVEIMQEVLQDEKTSETERITTGRWLNYLHDDAKSIIENASPIIIEAGLKRAIKAGVVDALELSPEEFSEVTIAPETVNEGITTYRVSTQNESYTVDETSIYGEMIEHLYDIQREENRSFELNLRQSKEALNLIKVSAYSGAKLSNNNEITSEISYNDINTLQKKQ